MKNLFILMLAVVALGLAGCATQSDDSNPWEYKSVNLDTFSDAGMQGQLQQYINQGWTITQISNTRTTATTRHVLVLMQRPRQIPTRMVDPSSDSNK